MMTVMIIRVRMTILKMVLAIGFVIDSQLDIMINWVYVKKTIF